MQVSFIHPPEWKAASGYSNGVLVTDGGPQLFLAGQIAWNANQEIVGKDHFPTQFRQALQNVVDILQTAGGLPEHIVRMTIFVSDKDAYEADLPGVGAAYRDVVGRHFPAMSLVQVAALLEPGAMVEVEATAVLPKP
ncbi:MAG: RidA family protein [Planctomycetota bacterium]|jgi:enamine deaminase RidA (YjgF/YER057c/UK114 family)|nr:RidA family protein [Planctomycetota bacterium]MDG2143054.1 RidA family protein [Planctomycetota bacterium]